VQEAVVAERRVVQLPLAQPKRRLPRRRHRRPQRRPQPVAAQDAALPEVEVEVEARQAGLLPRQEEGARPERPARLLPARRRRLNSPMTSPAGRCRCKWAWK